MTTKNVEKKDKKVNFSGALDTLKNVIIGIGQLLVVVSIIYSSTVIWMGTDGVIPKVMISPAIVMAALIVVDNFVISRSK